MNKIDSEDAEAPDDLDKVLCDVGEFGVYQIGHFILMILPIVLSAMYAVEFIVTASTDDYRQVAQLTRPHFAYRAKQNQMSYS